MEDIEHKYLYIYPNPTFGKVFINDGNLGNNYNIKVFDMNGQLKHSSFNDQEVDIGHLPSDSYFINLNGDTGERTIKLIKK